MVKLRGLIEVLFNVLLLLAGLDNTCELPRSFSEACSVVSLFLDLALGCAVVILLLY
jgi:hypothetical protein